MAVLSLSVAIAIAGLISPAPASSLPSNSTCTSCSNDSDFGSSLRFAAYIGDVSAINDLIREGADVNSRDESNGIGTVALHMAAWGGHTGAIEALLAASGVQVEAMDTHNRTAMHFVAHAPASAVSALVRAGAKLDVRSSQNWTPMHMAILANNSAVAEALIEAGMDIESQGGPYLVRPLHLAVIMRQDRVIEALLTKRANVNAEVASLPGSVKTSVSPKWIPIRGSPYNGWHTKAARQLLAAMAQEQPEDNANRDIDHYDPLRDHKDTVKLLLESGQSVGDPFLSITAINLATRLGYGDIVETLLEHGADTQTLDCNGWAALHWAAYEGFTSVAQSLIAHGAAVNVADAKDKLTPLHLAFQKGHSETAELLIRAGADQQAKEALGWTPMQMAKPIQL